MAMQNSQNQTKNVCNKINRNTSKTKIQKERCQLVKIPKLVSAKKLKTNTRKAKAKKWPVQNTKIQNEKRCLQTEIKEAAIPKKSKTKRTMQNIEPQRCFHKKKANGIK